MAEEHRFGDERHRSLFNDCPVALCEADLSALLAALERLRDTGVSDPAAYLTQRPEELLRLASLIRVLAVNTAALKLSEAPDEQTLRAAATALFAEESFATFRDVVSAFARGERFFAAETAARTLGGKTVRCSLKGTILPIEAGKPTRLLLSVEDITAAKAIEEKLKESESLFRSIFDRAQDGMLMLDVETKRQIEANDAICAMLGYTRDEILGLPVDALHTAAELPFAMDALERQIRGDLSLAMDIPVLRKDGTVFHADVYSVPLMHHGRRCLLGVFRDCAARKRAELGIRESQQILESVIEAAPT